MQKILFIIMILLVSNFQVLGDDFRFDIERMISDFNGITYNEKIVIVYGTHGIILTSSDKGQSWLQKKICDDSLNIQKMINAENSFYAISENGFLLKSENNGDNWKLIKTKGNNYYYDLVDDGSYLYLLSQNTIEIYNYNLNFIKAIELNTTWSPWTICLYKDKIYFPTKYASIISLDIKNDFKFDEIVIAMYGSQAMDLKVKNGKLYTKINNNLYETENPEEGFIKVAEKINIYQVKNGEIYNLEVKEFAVWKVSCIDFYKIDEELQKIKINADSIDRYVNPVIIDFDFIDNDNIVAVGPDKTIYISINGGKNWILKSNAIKRNTSILKWLNKQIGFLANNSQIFKTTDAGVTWRPQIFTDTLIKNMKNINGFYIDSTGIGFAISHNSSIKLSDTTKDRTFIYTDDYGETFSGGFYSKYNQWINKYGIKIIKIDTFSIAYCVPQIWTLTTFIQYDSKFNPIKSYWIDSIDILNCKVNENNSLMAIGQISKLYTDTQTRDSSKIFFMESTDLGEKWLITETFKIDGDWPYTAIWDNDDLIIRTRSEIDSFYTTNIYFYNSQENRFNKILTIKDTLKVNSVSLMKYRNELFVFDNHKHLTYSSTNYYTNSPEWVEVKLSYLLFQPGAWCNDTIIYGSIYKQKLKETSGIIWVEYNDIYPIQVYPKTETLVEEKIEYSYYFFATPPSPSPANTSVKTTIYWDQDVDINLAKIKIYNFLGNEITNNKEITTIQIKSYCEEIVWDCTNVSSGLYFINISYENFSRSVPILIVK